ncbi:hypothetical protein [Alloyangia pacifica]|uniref:hypothetical protein n=1 Tax=Alloyangia pacifica TaxID=311180 RepID=UPI0031E1BB87
MTQNTRRALLRALPLARVSALAPPAATSREAGRVVGGSSADAMRSDPAVQRALLAGTTEPLETELT